MTANKSKIVSLIKDSTKLSHRVLVYLADHLRSNKVPGCHPALVVNGHLYNDSSIVYNRGLVVAIHINDYSDYNKKIILSTSSISRIKPTLDDASGDKGIIMDIYGKKSIVKLVYIV